MTLDELEKQRLRDLKNRAAASLQAMRLDAYPALACADSRISAYVEEVRCHPSRHNLYELLAVERFMRLQARYEFRPAEVKRFVVFYESLLLTG